MPQQTLALRRGHWPDWEKDRLAELWHQGLSKTEIAAALRRTKGAIDGQSMRQHLHYPTGGGRPIAAGSPADVKAQSRFHGRVEAPGRMGVLKPGWQQRKIGGEVLKGAWKGMPIYTLTLEERATCPRSCKQWLNCLVPETRVLCADLRWREIGTLHVGSEICAFEEEGRKLGHRSTKIATVEEIGRAIQPCFKVRTDQGDVTASAGHLWLARNSRAGYRWIKTADLTPDTEIQFFARPWESDRSYEAGRLRGFVEGEGYCVKQPNGKSFQKVTAGWAQRPTPLADDIEAVAQRLGFQVSRYHRIAGVAHTEICHFDILGGWREVIRFLGVIRPTRLIEKAKELWEGQDTLGRGGRTATVLALEPAGDRKVVTIKTSTGTLIAEGLLSHNCYGNNMIQSVRYKHGDRLEQALGLELGFLQQRHPGGFVLRLHILGDFYSVDYVKFWEAQLDWFPALRIFGYTAREASDPIGAEINRLRAKRWNRFAIRTSGAARGPRTIVVPDSASSKPDSAITCPAQTGGTTHCGNCGLCWAPAAKQRPIAFLQH